MGTEVTEQDRWVHLERCGNFRDMGGYRTTGGRTLRWRRLFRSAHLGRLSEADVACVRDQLGIRTVIDLRHEEELEKAGRAVIADHEGVRFMNVSWNRKAGDDPEDPMPGVERLWLHYLWTFRGVGHAVAQALTVLSDPESYPVVFHCAGGKDRTGMLAAVVLDLLDVPHDVIVADYHLTEQARSRLTDEQLAAAVRIVSEAGMHEEVLRARERTMVEFLEGVRGEHGSIRDYVASQGIGPDVIESLRSNLLE